MKDSVTTRLQDARTLLVRAAVDMPEGEARSRTHLALAAVQDALDARTSDLSAKTLRHLEVIADALAAPGKDAA